MNTCTYVREIEWCDCVYSYITYVTGSVKPDHIVSATKMEHGESANLGARILQKMGIYCSC